MRMPDQHWFFFKDVERSDYDDLLIIAKRLGATSLDDLYIQWSISGGSPDVLIVRFKIVSTGSTYTARWRTNVFWFIPSERRRLLHSVT